MAINLKKLAEALSNLNPAAAAVLRRATADAPTTDAADEECEVKLVLIMMAMRIAEKEGLNP